MTKGARKTDYASTRLFDRFFVAPRANFIARRRLTASHLPFAGTPHNLIKIVFVGTSSCVLLLFVMICASYIVFGNTYVLPRIILFLPVVLYLTGIGVCIVRLKFVAAAWMLIGLYVSVAALVLWFWSINAPIGILALGFVIILAGTTLSARLIVPVAALAVAILALLQTAYELGIAQPNTQTLSNNPTFGDVTSYGVIFSIFALITWLSRRQLEQALSRALAAESALENEKVLLAHRLEEQTRRLRETQLEEMRQLYRFAELGQLSTALLHELANRLTVLTLDIDDIGQRDQQSEAVTRAKESIEHLDAMVAQVREQLHDNKEFEEFNIIDTLEETIRTLQPKARAVGTSIVLQRHGRMHRLYAFGDPLRLSHIMTILIGNAIDAYAAMNQLPASPVIEVTVTSAKTSITITVSDNAGGISTKDRLRLFTPFKSNKQTGMGIGLFIARHMTETHFSGTLRLDKRTDRTRFIMTIPAPRKGK